VIRYSCPVCKTFHEAPDLSAHIKHECKACGQRIQVPPAPVRQHTILAKSEPPVPVLELVEPPSSPPQPLRRSGCPCCGCRDRPFCSSRISTGGWVVFAVLLVFFFPLFWIGLLMKDTFYHCRRCGYCFGRAL
jgi:hypothetical protein